MSISVMDNLEVHVFSDASEKAVAAYLRAIDTYGTSTVGFIMGKSKLAPLSGNTIPRLELCGAVLATEIGKIISENLDVPLDSIKYYSDSKFVLGYITNQTRRFHTYVSNRIERILSVSSSNQWQFVPTHLNPSDCGTRYSISVDMENNPWLLGPKWMKNSDEEAQCDVKILYPLVSPDNDKEIRKEISASKTSIDALAPIVGRFKKISSWRRLVKAISFMQHVAQSFSLKG
ncbi:uncharacterized protein [Mytilus edulis]|uniref:uncharacterized protein n=1 Tax=Mytilus edulis TaxID=6550 RepID=UPI0039F0952E